MKPSADATFEILRADHPTEHIRWLKTWEAWPAREVFAHPSYVGLFGKGRDVAAAAVGHAQGMTILYPFIIRPLQNEPFWEKRCGDCVDLVSPYGYGGPYWWGEGDRALAAIAFWGLFDEWASRSDAVSEFVRFDLHPERLVPYPGVVEVKSANVIRSLDLLPEDLWMDTAHKVRKNVQRARRSGLEVIRDARGDRLEDFLRIYWGTMASRGADPRFLLSREWFERLIEGLPEQFLFFHVLRANAVVSSELVLVSADLVYSYLGGTDPSSFADRPNDLLKYEIMLSAREEGKRAFVLGGGFRPDDGIFHFKQSFAPNGVVPYSVGKRVLDPVRYGILCRRASADGNLNPPDPLYFPRYRGWQAGRDLP